MSVNWILLQLAKITSFVASLRIRREPREIGWARKMNSVKLCVDSRRTATVKNLPAATPDTVNNKGLTLFRVGKGNA